MGLYPCRRNLTVRVIVLFRRKILLWLYVHNALETAVCNLTVISDRGFFNNVFPAVNVHLHCLCNGEIFTCCLFTILLEIFRHSKGFHSVSAVNDLTKQLVQKKKNYSC